MTEEQAREKWCPMAAANRGRRADTRCIASDCMAWRLGEMATCAVDMNKPERGYCGLAGSPGRAV